MGVGPESTGGRLRGTFALLLLVGVGQHPSTGAAPPAPSETAEQAAALWQEVEPETALLQVVREGGETLSALQARGRLVLLYPATHRVDRARQALDDLLRAFPKHTRLPHTLHALAEACHERGCGGVLRDLLETRLAAGSDPNSAIHRRMARVISLIVDEADTERVQAALDELTTAHAADPGGGGTKAATRLTSQRPPSHLGNRRSRRHRHRGKTHEP